MYRRVVFVGLGGSGGKTIRFLKRDLRHWLTEHGWPESRDIPSGFQFLHIDTPTVQDGRSMTGADMLPDNEYLGLVGAGTSYTDVVTKLDRRIGVQEEFAGWRVPPPIPVPIIDGAGAYRAVGRTIALAYLDQVRTGLESLVNRVLKPQANSDLGELWRMVHGEMPGGKTADPLVIVISSLAGGTGAGLLMDVFDVLRSLEPWGDNSFGILYTPEVFASIGGGLMHGVQPNSLAAISEILNGHYWHGVQQGNNEKGMPTEIGLKTPKVFEVSGATGAIARSGPAFPFLVGSTNAGGVHFSTDKEVFETIGGALVAWCIDPISQDQLTAFAFANWAAKASENLTQSDLLINKGEAEEQGAPAFNALGCARVSVGTRYLERYSAQRLARDAVTYIAGYHMESDEAHSFQESLGSNKPQEIAKAIAQSKFNWFVQLVGLQERGIEFNHVLDALRPEELGALTNTAIASSAQLADIGRASAEAYLEQIIDAVRNSLVTFDEKIRPLIERNKEKWVETMPTQLMAVVEQAIGNYGMAVTVELIDQLIHYLTNPVDGVCTELLAESEKEYSVYASEAEWSSRAATVLAGIKGNFTMQSTDKVMESIAVAVGYGNQIVEVQVREQASSLLTEFAKSVLIPLKRSLSDVSLNLDKKIGEVSSWPTWSEGLPPLDSTPPSSEYTLIEPARFASVFIDTLAKTVGGDPTQKPLHRADARAAVISGDFLRVMEAAGNNNRNLVRPAQAIQITQPWNPGSAILRNANRPKSDLIVDLKFEPSDFQQRARMWLRRDNTAFENLLKSTLSTYTSGSTVFSANMHVEESEYAERRVKFIAQLQKAIGASAPLVELDIALHQHIHPVRPFKIQFSSFPFNGHALQDEVIKAISPHVKDDGNVDEIESVKKYLVNDGSIESIQIMSFLNGPHYPFLFSSLLEPIGQRWAKNKDTKHEISNFWTKRRARLLGEFIPAPQEHIIAMIRGWFTGRLLGLIDVPRNGRNYPIRISQPWSLESGPISFPDPLLTTPTNAGDELFAVLEALSLAFVMVGQQNNLSPLSPYINLRDMGITKKGEQILRYDTANPLIESWINFGTVKSSFNNKTKSEDALRLGLESKMHTELVKVSESNFSPDERKKAFLAVIDTVKAQYAAEASRYWDLVSLNKSTLNNPPYWPSIRNTSETPDVLIRAIDSLRNGVEQMKTEEFNEV